LRPSPTTPACRRSEQRPDEFDLSLYELAQATDIHPLVIETVLTHLELDGIIRPLGSFYAGYQFRLLEPEAALLGRHMPERQAFLRTLLRSGKRGTKWITVETDAAAAELAEPRDRIVKALGWLSDSGAIELKPSGSWPASCAGSRAPRPTGSGSAATRPSACWPACPSPPCWPAPSRSWEERRVPLWASRAAGFTRWADDPRLPADQRRRRGFGGMSSTQSPYPARTPSLVRRRSGSAFA
jgi:hypothetical protein